MHFNKGQCLNSLVHAFPESMWAFIGTPVNQNEIDSS